MNLINIVGVRVANNIVGYEFQEVLGVGRRVCGVGTSVDIANERIVRRIVWKQ